MAIIVNFFAISYRTDLKHMPQLTVNSRFKRMNWNPDFGARNALHTADWKVMISMKNTLRGFLIAVTVLAASSFAAVHAQPSRLSFNEGSSHVADSGWQGNWGNGNDHDGGGGKWNKPPIHTPEPGTLALLGSGLLIVGLFGRRLFARRS